MKKIFKKLVIALVVLIVVFAGVLLLLDKVIMPRVVDRPIVTVPDLVGMKKDRAVKVLDSLGLAPVLKGPRYSHQFPKDYVIFQKPHKNVPVKINRRIYLAISGGDPLIKAPGFMGKTLRDAKITIESLGLKLGKISEVRTEFPANTIVDQDPKPGKNISKGTKINLEVSIGPSVGKIRVPDLIGKSLSEVKKILRDNSLYLGKVSYQKSLNLLPNTIIAQYPSKGKLVDIGESIDVFVTKSSK